MASEDTACVLWSTICDNSIWEASVWEDLLGEEVTSAICVDCLHSGFGEDAFGLAADPDADVVKVFTYRDA